jgi:hypothetical protein
MIEIQLNFQKKNSAIEIRIDLHKILYNTLLKQNLKSYLNSSLTPYSRKFILRFIDVKLISLYYENKFPLIEISHLSKAKLVLNKRS